MIILKAVLIAVNAATFPVPEAAKPMLVLSFVQLYCCAEPEKVIDVVESPAQTIWSGIGSTVAFEVTVKLLDVVEQPVAVLVKLKDAIPSAVPVTRPLEEIDAIEGLLVIHVPPNEGLSCAVEPTQREAGAETVGCE